MNQPSEVALTPPPDRSGLPPALRTLLGLAAAVIVLAGMWLGRELIGPLALAAVIVLICHPVRHPLERRGWPRGAATAAVIAVAYAVLVGMALLLGYAGAEFTRMVIDYSGQLGETVTEITALLGSLGLESQLADAAGSILSPGAIIGFVRSFAGSLLGVLTALFFIFAYVLFMAADGARYARATTDFGPSAQVAVSRFQTFGTGVRRYYVVNAIFGLIVAAIDGIALWAMSIPGALVWAILAFVTNFIPNIGFVLGLIPSMLLALVIGGWPLMVAVIVIYSVVNATLQVLVQPKFVSDAVDLSLTLSFFSVLFWTFVIGPLGAILSIPLTLLVRALILEPDPGSTWLRWLSGDSKATQSIEPAD